MRCFTFFGGGVLSVQNLIGVLYFTHLDSNQPRQVVRSPMWLMDTTLTSVGRRGERKRTSKSLYKAAIFLTLLWLSNFVLSHNKPIKLWWLRLRTREPGSLVSNLSFIVNAHLWEVTEGALNKY